MRLDYDEVIRDYQVTVVEHEGVIVAVLALCLADEGFLLDNIAVAPDHQGVGLGRWLLEYAESEARRQGFDSIYLYTQEIMTENLALYLRVGYVEYARRVELGTAPRVPAQAPVDPPRPGGRQVRSDGRGLRRLGLREQHRGEVPLAGVAEDGDDELALVLRAAADHGTRRRRSRRRRCRRGCPPTPARARPRTPARWSPGRPRRRPRVLSTLGTKPAPMPWILCGPGSPPLSTGESVGSTATM